MSLDNSPPPVANGEPIYSIVVPVLNEQGAAPALAREIATAFGDRLIEILFVDDGSTDDTVALLSVSAKQIPRLRILRHRRTAGQSRAIRTGVLAARASIIVTLDGDGQNDPADAPAMAAALAADAGLGLIGGVRRLRRDSRSKRWASKAANAIRRGLLGDGAEDTGCGLKVFRRDAYLLLPYFDHNHRYLPALMQREGFQVAYVGVNHRQRQNGQSKYNNWARFWGSVSDLAGVMWLGSRRRDHGGVDSL